jgi:hypothetical protein
VHFRAGTDCPPGVTKASAALFDLEHDGMLRDGRLGELDAFIDLASKSGHELRAYDDALDFVAGLRDADRRAAKLNRLFPRGAGAIEHPWIERDPKTGGQNLKIPLPPPETARRLADMFGALTERLRG